MNDLTHNEFLLHLFGRKYKLFWLSEKKENGFCFHCRLESNYIIVYIMNYYLSQFIFGFHSEPAIENNSKKCRWSNEAQDHPMIWFIRIVRSESYAAHGGWNERKQKCIVDDLFRALNEHLSRLPINVIIQIFKLIQLLALTFWTKQNCEIFHIVLTNFRRRICLGPICRTQSLVIAHFKMINFNRQIGSTLKAALGWRMEMLIVIIIIDWLNLPI